MSNFFLGEIRMFAGNFAPFQWALCNGQLMPINQNAALFSLLGTSYGGNGTSTFGLPNLQNSAPLGQGNGAGLTPRVLGEIGGEPTVTLLTTEIPAHSHTPMAASTTANNQATPSANSWGTGGRGMHLYAPSDSHDTTMKTGLLPTVGSGLPHNNLPPFLVLTFIISLVGIFPSRN